MSFGKRLKQLRMQKKLTQKELSNILKISESAVGMYEREEREPSFEVVRKLAAYFDVSTDELILGERIADKLKDDDQNINLTKEDSTDYELQFLSDLDNKLPLDLILKKYNLIFDDVDLNEEEIRGIFAYLRAARSMKNN
ncbi:helix-turn-helix transcriptional regulator [Alkalihalophilus marmarensis]|uniref:helix-turn-helix domain-containing protein n=1 Tax=Alkalihalophilus marmarensis TaxID=521377 RepID=UPI002E241793|nr:helix-turn-helix transcriptional regulator [Alkalihalophilus marmarensis]